MGYLLGMLERGYLKCPGPRQAFCLNPKHEYNSSARLSSTQIMRRLAPHGSWSLGCSFRIVGACEFDCVKTGGSVPLAGVTLIRLI